jgi:hypothetical protein
MSVFPALAALVGQWTGTKRIFLFPDDPVRESLSKMTVAFIAQEKFMTFQYTWSDEGQPQDGLLMLGKEKASWVDSWHMQEGMMNLTVEEQTPGLITAKGSYSVGDGPEWGWQITIQPKPDGTFAFTMYNIEPDANPELAVEIQFSRAS